MTNGTIFWHGLSLQIQRFVCKKKKIQAPFENVQATYTWYICYTHTHTPTHTQSLFSNSFEGIFRSELSLHSVISDLTQPASWALISFDSNSAPRICLKAFRFSRITGGSSFFPLLCYVGISRLSKHKLSTGKNQF